MKTLMVTLATLALISGGAFAAGCGVVTGKVHPKVVTGPASAGCVELGRNSDRPNGIKDECKVKRS